MTPDYPARAAQLLEAVGGRENVIANMACSTRLRLRLADMGATDVKALKSVEGVLGVVTGGEGLEVVLGPGVASRTLEAFVELTGIPAGEMRGATTASGLDGHHGLAQRFLKRIANVFVPLLPGLIAAGLINGITNIVNVSTGGSLANEWWYACIATMGWALFFYLPVLVGMNACREFGGSGVLGAMAGALSIPAVAMPLLRKATDGSAAVMLPIGIPTASYNADTNVLSVNLLTSYNPAVGGLLGALICGAFFALVERTLRRAMPDFLDTFLTPLLTVALGSLVAVLVLQPIGGFLTQGLYLVLDFVYSKLGALGGFLLSAAMLPLVSVGMHQAFTPIHAMLNDPDGPTNGINYLLPILMMAGGGQVGAGIALYLKTANERARRYVAQSIPVAILGVGEPLMYAVTLPLGKPFVTACLGAGVGGACAALFRLGAISQGVSGIFGLLILVPGSQPLYLAALGMACASGFALTWLFGVDEARIDEVFGRDAPVERAEGETLPPASEQR